MGWNMPEGSSPLDYERAEGLDRRDETWRNDEGDEEPIRTARTGERSAFEMVAHANELLRQNAELNRMLARLYEQAAPKRIPAQMELGESQEDAA